MPRLILVRPAETDHALSDSILGRTDADLNETGHLDAVNLSEALQAFPVSHIAVSPLKRAIATAMPLHYDMDVQMNPVSGFQAADMGDWDTMPLDVVRATDMSRYDTWFRDPDFPSPGGESMREVYARAYPALANLVEYAKVGETMVLIVQKSVLRALCCAILNLPLESGRRFHMDHGAFSVFERITPGGPYQMMAWNCTSHLNRPANTSIELEDELPV